MLYKEIWIERLNKGDATLAEALNWLCSHGVKWRAAREMLHER